MKISIVTTMYNSAAYLTEFYRRSSAAAAQITKDYEIVFINDGSPDNSLETAVSLYEQDKRVKIIDLSRNFGHHKAMMTGLNYASGELVFLIDSDLEEAPELLIEFYEKINAVKADVVYGVQRTRKGNWFERFSGEIYYTLFNFFSDYQMPRNVITARLMTRPYVKSLVAHRERELNMLGLWTITGFNQIPVVVHKDFKGKSSYNLRLKIAILVNAVTSFSDKPLIFIFYVGWLIFVLSTISAIYLVIRQLFFDYYLAGWASLIVSIWLMGGLTLICLGIIGIYLSKIYIETKQRPYTLIKNIYEWEKGEEQEFQSNHNKS